MVVDPQAGFSEGALHALLCRLFRRDGSAVREYIRSEPGGDSLLFELPSPPATPSSLIQEWIDLGRRSGAFDGKFFQRLMVAFPRQANEIRDLARQWNLEPGDVSLPRRNRMWFATILVPAALAAGLVATLRPEFPAAGAIPGADDPDRHTTMYRVIPDRAPQDIPLTRRAVVGLLREDRGLASCWAKMSRSGWTLNDFNFQLRDAAGGVVASVVNDWVSALVADCFERRFISLLRGRRLEQGKILIELRELRPSRSQAQ